MDTPTKISSTTPSLSTPKPQDIVHFQQSASRSAMPPTTPSKDNSFVFEPASSPPDATPARPERSTIRPADPSKPPTQKRPAHLLRGSRPSSTAMTLSDSATMTPSAGATSDPPVSLSPRKLRSSTNSNKRERADSTDRGADHTRFLEALTETSVKRGQSVYPDGPTSFVFAGKPRSSGTTKRAKTEANAGAPAPETASATNQPRRGKRVSPTQGAATGQRAGDALKSGAGPANDDGKHDYEKHDYKKHDYDNHACNDAREPHNKREKNQRETNTTRAARNPTQSATASTPQPPGTAQRRSGLTGKLDDLAILAAAASHGRPGAL